MSLHHDRMIKSDGGFSVHEWASVRRAMILRDESHVLVSIEDIDRLLEKYNPNAQADLIETRRELEHAESMWSQTRLERNALEAKVRDLKLLLGNIAADAGSIEAKAHGALASDPA